MKTKIMIGSAMLVAVLTVACWLLVKPAPPIAVAANPSPVAPAPTPDAVPDKVTPPETAPVVVVQKTAKPEMITASQPAQKNNPPAPKAPLQDPDARIALSLVGADPEAEAYWLSAISDTSLPDQEREDLMEDLNEDGLSDPKHPGPDDMPLIANRIAIIEQIMPDADPFMQEHLGEAYKDLNNLLAGRGAK